jgi:uncharacterized membrane protein YgdD (TMEM256/DUF423 family)
MNVLDKRILIIATLFMLLGIIFGALGAHALEKVLTVEQLASYEVGVKYQIYHGIALLALVALTQKLNFTLKLIYRFLIIGVIIFSGSIYALVFQNLIGVKLGMLFGPLTPIGGLLMITGWLLFLIKLLKTKCD